MKIALGADHAGFEMKNLVAAQLRSEGHQIVDYGTNSTESTDYPDFARVVAEAVSKGEAERGILVCGTGAGQAIAANKVPGIRAAVGFIPEQVAVIRGHNDINVLALGARFTKPEDAILMSRVFLSAPFEGGRHERRVQKIAALENHG